MQKKIDIHVYLPENVHRAVQEMADRDLRSVTAQVVFLTLQGLDAVEQRAVRQRAAERAAMPKAEITA